MTLDTQTLWRLDSGNRDFSGEWSPMPLSNEEELLETIGMDYVDPHLRNFSNLLRRRRKYEKTLARSQPRKPH